MGPPLLHIVGQGLAGTALAWRCVQREIPFRIIDDARPSTASKVAAGIVTPIAGQRLALTQGWSFIESMETFYQDIGTRLGETFYERRETVRFLTSPLEEERWSKRLGDPRYEDEIVPSSPSLNPDHFAAPFGAFTLKRSGCLRVRAWLERSRRWFQETGVWKSDSLHPDTCPSNGNDLWIFANGPWLFDLKPFDWLPMRYAHGDILTLSIPQLGDDPRIFNGGCWLRPLGHQQWQAGSTYEARSTPLTTPSHAGRAHVESQIQEFLRCEYEVLDHAAAVRPVTQTRFPTMGQHPGRSHLAWFGGFSSKGVLTAPHYANAFLDHLLNGIALPPEVEAP